MRKDNSYCQISIDEQSMADPRDRGNRYLFINFRPAFTEHGTIEFRVFPANKPEKMEKYLNFTFRVVKYFLRNSERFLNSKEEIFDDDEENPKMYNVEETIKEGKGDVEVSECVNDKAEKTILEEKKYV